MTKSEAVKRYVGKRALLDQPPKDARGGGDFVLHHEVEVLDASLAFGRVRVLVSPVSGHGQQWVTPERLGLDS